MTPYRVAFATKKEKKEKKRERKNYVKTMASFASSITGVVPRSTPGPKIKSEMAIFSFLNCIQH